jgi:hypothetical protein
VKSKNIKPALLVLLALVLSAPTLANILSGSVSAASAGMYLAGAILVSWLAVGTISYLVDSYRTAALRRQYEQERHSPRPS